MTRDYREKCFEEHGEQCAICGDPADVAHHIDGDRDNNDVENLAPLCESCHGKVHASEDRVEGWSEKIKSGRYTFENKRISEGGKQTTITVDESTLERFKQLKAELDNAQSSVPDHTNESFLQSLMDTWEAAEDGYYDDDNVSEIAEEIKEQLSMANEPGVEVEEEKLISEIEKLQEIVERVPEEAADKFKEKYA